MRGYGPSFVRTEDPLKRLSPWRPGQSVASRSSWTQASPAQRLARRMRAWRQLGGFGPAGGRGEVTVTASRTRMTFLAWSATQRMRMVLTRPMMKVMVAAVLAALVRTAPGRGRRLRWLMR